MFEKLFLAHPRAVGESYVEHMGMAAGFGARLFLASLACFLHALVPGLCVKTGSNAIRELHDRMVVHRVRNPGAAAQPLPQ
ncbi:MAG TPA: DUF6356 family protein [Alphaproteobacteria bacterium]|nr:DUF6356 family protein [Alphaproteobacteria bacterium]